MAHFIGRAQGNTDKATRVGHKTSGMAVSCNGWACGVTVEASHENGRDVFRVYETNGTKSYNIKRELIAEVIDNGSQ